MEWNIGIALLSLIVGVLLGGVSNAVVGRYAAFRESQGIAAALISEISTITELIEQRGYINALNTLITRLQNPAHQATYQDMFSVSITQDYFAVFNSVCPRIGLLGPLSGGVTRFYGLSKVLIEDVNSLREIQKQSIMVLTTIPRQPLLQHYINMVTLAQMMLNQGSEVIGGLRHYTEQYFLGRQQRN
ncbi:MAG: hypothetical protein V3T60_11175 [Candidatus Binatia bacterium]